MANFPGRVNDPRSNHYNFTLSFRFGGLATAVEASHTCITVHAGKITKQIMPSALHTDRGDLSKTHVYNRRFLCSEKLPLVG